ncbi:hypothetical protein PK28_04040 [Hymenobacter sp. DG25B]|uniref:porin family protein n=1 Tax=Hymenobacter sp. DG25B TaxID=1385664 RepID=UPI000540E155|nr:porin family protein [Hymenobacter sp. DG25B]AIZ63070.1 hypothetical protein PK28_04040 [Hymenobacter sp. DG25B]
MKKSTVLVAALLSVAAFSSAQAQGVRLGLRAGANYSNLSGNIKNENTYNNKLGFVGGVMLNAPIVENFFSIQPELLYSQKGFENKPTEYTNILGYQTKREGKVNYNYLDLPILAKINADGFYFEAGPQISYLLSSNNQTKTTTTSPLTGEPETSQAENQNDVSELNRTELGYAAGLGYQAENGLSIGLRYTGAFSDLVKSDNGDTYFNGDLKNARHSAFQVSLGYLIGNK